MRRNAAVVLSVVKVVLACAILAIVSTNLSADQSDDLANLVNRTKALYDAGRSREAIPLADYLVAHADEVFGDHPQNLAASFEVAGMVYQDQGLYAKAEPLLKRVILIRENALGRDHLHVALAYNNLALLFCDQAKYAESERLHRRALEIRETTLGKEHPEVAASLYNLTLLFDAQGRFAEAESSELRALAIREKAFGKDHPDVALSLNALAGVYCEQGPFAEAERLYLRALAIREKALDKEHFRLAESLHNLAVLYKDQARYVEAEALYPRALAIWEKSRGKDHVAVASCLNNMGNLISAQGRKAEAAQLYQRALAIYEKSLGKDHPKVALALSNLATEYRSLGRYADAEPMYQRALAIWERALGKNHPDVALVLNNLSFIYRMQGRTPEATKMLERALRIREETLGAEHHLVANSLNDLAMVHYQYDKYAEAEPLLRRALAIWEKSLGKDHPEVAYALDNLARVASNQKKYAEAEGFFLRALNLREQSYGKDSGHVADTLCNLAGSYLAQDKIAQAEALAERAVTIWDLADASAQDRFRGYGLRTQVRWEAKKKDLALADLNHAIDLAEQIRGQGAGGETERAELFTRYARAYERMVGWQQELGHPAEVLLAIERSRARSLVDQLATANIDLLAGVPGDEAETLRTRQSTAQTQLAQLEKQAELIAADKNLSEAKREQKTKALDDQLRSARDEVVNAYLAIRNASPVYRQMVGKDFKPSGLADIQTRLVGEDGLLLEYFLGDEAGYVVIIPPAGGKTRVEPLVVSKEQAASLGIESGPLTHERMQKILANETGTGLLQQLRNATKAEATTDRLAVLWNVLIPEAERKLLVEARLKRCIVIPDAALAAFPFDTLVVEPGEKPKYLLDVGPPIVTAPSTTLLMNLSESKSAAQEDPAKPPKKSALLSVADPNYGVPSTDAGLSIVELKARSRYGALHGDLKALPFTGWECSWVTEAFRKAGFDTGALQKANAREASVRMYAPGRTYLHFACHGLVDQSYGNLFGALALTPGPRGSADPADDGFLTLAEIYELNLRGTELSILSACDTNYGPNQKGEGVWSLSRGFLVAGSKRVIASNWLVDDEAGASLVSVFCGAITKEKQGEPLDYAASLQAAKRWVRNQDKWKSPYYWGTFVLVGPN